MGLGDATVLKEKVEEQFLDNYYTIDEDKWLVAAEGLTTKDVAAKLGMAKTGGTRGIVISIAGYNGLAPADIWEWLKAKASKANA